MNRRKRPTKSAAEKARLKKLSAKKLDATRTARTARTARAATRATTRAAERQRSRKKQKPSRETTVKKAPKKQPTKRSPTKRSPTKKTESTVSVAQTPKTKKEKAPGQETDEGKAVKTALGELKRAVKEAAKNSKRAYGYDPQLKTHHDIKGAFAGYKYKRFSERSGQVQGVLRDKFPSDYQRDLHTQAVHVRKYMYQGDRNNGLRSIIEKVQNAGRECIEKKLRNKKTGKPLRIYQIYIARIRILVREKDLGKYLGYHTQPISGKKSKAASDIRGLTGFENVSPKEDPRDALDRILDRLEDHLVDILDGLPAIYVKSLEIKFDTEAQ